MRLWPSKLAIPAAVSSTNAPNATSIITTSTTARWIFMVSRSLPAMELGPVLRLGTVTSTQDVAHDLGIGSVVLADYQTGGRGRAEPAAGRGIRSAEREDRRMGGDAGGPGPCPVVSAVSHARPACADRSLGPRRRRRRPRPWSTWRADHRRRRVRGRQRHAPMRETIW